MSTKSTKLKFCGCAWCRTGLRSGPNVKSMVNHLARSARRKWNLHTKNEEDDRIGPISIPYTD